MTATPALMLAAVVAIAPAGAACAHENPPPAGVLSLSASASAEVANDTALITVFVERQAADAESAAAAVARVLDQATRQARQVTGVEVRTGSFSTYPNYDRSGKITGWRSRGELILESKDFARLAELAAQLNPLMQIAQVAFTLSRAARAAEENRLIDQAVEAFRAKADHSAKAFGYGRYTLREVNITSQPDIGPIPRFARATAAAPAEAVPVPLEGGRTAVTVTVSGSVQMER